MKQIIQLVTEESFKENKNFNIASTIINDNVRVSTAAIYYQEWFGDRFQLETFIFKREGNNIMKIHDVPCNNMGLDYCKRFHHLASLIADYKLKQKTK